MPESNGRNREKINHQIKKLAFIILMIFGITLVDQLSKSFVQRWSNEQSFSNEQIISFGVKKNYGYAGGFSTDNKNHIVFQLVGIFVLGLLYFIENKKNFLFLLSLGFMIGGGFANLLDRIVKNYVIDFIKIKFINLAGYYNIADFFIITGIIILIINLFIKRRSKLSKT